MYICVQRTEKSAKSACRFSSLFFVDTNIQSSAHDSIVDARTALLLYKEYQKLAADGADKFKTILKELYDKGRLLKWKIPCTQTDDDTAVDKFESELQEIM